ncbi:adenosine receptor A2b-like [Centruroides vittatus]|uniref:adenosine receptor A2b-like n=1 Tax=Centruroides vittatus TaxID=120091 RepID=UPI0035104247
MSSIELFQNSIPIHSNSRTFASVTSPWESAGETALAILVVFILSPLIICSNALLVLAINRYKRLRNPSNYFLLSLSTADLGIGLALPLGLYFEFSRSKINCVFLCLFPYSVLVVLCGVSILSLTAISLDRYTSLATPLRYNNIITHRSVTKYIIFFWVYSILLGLTPLVYWFYYRGDATDITCSFDLIRYQVRLFLIFALFIPCSTVMIVCYLYIYFVARSHARAIFTVEISLRQVANSEPRYGRTLALTVGLFIITWLPFQLCVFIDVFQDSHLLSGRLAFYFGILLLANSAINPCIYGFRNAEFKAAFLRIIESVLPKLSGVIRRRYEQRNSLRTFTRCQSHVRLCASPNQIISTDMLRVSYLRPMDTIELTAASSTPYITTPGEAGNGEIGIAVL